MQLSDRLVLCEDSSGIRAHPNSHSKNHNLWKVVMQVGLAVLLLWQSAQVSWPAAYMLWSGTYAEVQHVYQLCQCFNLLQRRWLLAVSGVLMHGCFIVCPAAVGWSCRCCCPHRHAAAAGHIWGCGAAL